MTGGGAESGGERAPPMGQGLSGRRLRPGRDPASFEVCEKGKGDCGGSTKGGKHGTKFRGRPLINLLATNYTHNCVVKLFLLGTKVFLEILRCPEFFNLIDFH